MAIIETKDLAYRYSAGTPFEKTAVENVSIQVEKGEFLGVGGRRGTAVTSFAGVPWRPCPTVNFF